MRERKTGGQYEIFLREGPVISSRFRHLHAIQRQRHIAAAGQAGEAGLLQSRTLGGFGFGQVDDPIRVENAVGWYMALKRAGVKAEMHLYSEGGHGYGIFRTGHPVSNWTALTTNWLYNLLQIK